MFRPLFISLLLVALGLACAGPCLGADAGAPVRLATSEWAPFTSSTMPGYGFYTELVSAVFKEMGLTPKYSFYPWKRCEGNTASGKIWATFPYTITSERAETFDFSEKISSSTSKFFYYGKNRGYVYNTLADLKKYKIGGISGYFYTERFAREGINVFYTPDEKSGFNMLREGRIDLLALNDMVGWHIINTNFGKEKDGFHTLEKPLSDNPLRLMVSRNYPDSKALLERFNAALATVKASDTFDAILKKHGLLH